MLLLFLDSFVFKDGTYENSQNARSVNGDEWQFLFVGQCLLPAAGREPATFHEALMMAIRFNDSLNYPAEVYGNHQNRMPVPAVAAT